MNDGHMNNLFKKLALFLLSLLLRIRYKVQYKGLEDVVKRLQGSKRGILFLPNHPAAVIDPLLVATALLRYFPIRPLIVEYMYFSPLFHPFVRWFNALCIPNFSTGFNPIKLKRAEKMLAEMSRGLKVGEHFLIYPSGTTKSTGKERIGGAFGVHQLITENPDVDVVLVNMTGLWGSSFSRAHTAPDPIDTKKVITQSLWTACKNFLFFVPKRNVTIHFEYAGSAFAEMQTKQQVNTFLENWYNKEFPEAGEPLSLVSYSFWRKELLVPQLQNAEVFDLSHVPKEIQDVIVSKVSELSKQPKEKILPNLLLVEHLGLDSLDMAELITFLEMTFDVDGIVPHDVTSVQRLYMIATKVYSKKEVQEKNWNKSAWNKKRRHKKLTICQAETTVEAFFKVCDKNLFALACADPKVGPTSNYTIKKSILLLSKLIKDMPGDRIGILLPASTMSMMLILACQYAKKTPVMINWTVGGKHLDTVVEVAGIQKVLSSWTFLDALDNVDLSVIEPLITVLEECRVEISLFDLIYQTVRAFLPSRFFSFAHLHTDDEAVLLFTSGTESMPKGVPLTHANLLANQRASLERVELFADDTLLAFLPPFHSFGFAITGLLPLLSGLRVVFYPNPTESKRLVRALKEWGVTVVCSAPTFLKGILQQEEKVVGMRLVITGAEKLTDELVNLIHARMPHAVVYDGYGITECAPVLTVNTTGDSKKGVGMPLANVQIRIADPENIVLERARGEQGMILASGPNIFSGYLNIGLHDPFVEIDGVRWYQTGDLGSFSPEGYLCISGRQKRFVKIGGEMVSLASIEDALQTLEVRTKKTQNMQQFSVAAQEDGIEKAKLVLFSIHSLDLAFVNQILRKCGFSNLVKIDRIIVVDTIPMTATGKVSYRGLDKLLQGAQT